MRRTGHNDQSRAEHIFGENHVLLHPHDIGSFRGHGVGSGIQRKDALALCQQAQQRHHAVEAGQQLEKQHHDGAVLGQLQHEAR